MLNLLFQIPIIPSTLPRLIIIISSIVGFILIELIMLKIGLSISKAETRKNFVWVLGSFGIQIGLFIFISSPVILMSFAGVYQTGPPVFPLIIVILIFVIVDVNAINILHKVGIGKSIVVLICLTIPLLFFILMVTTRIIPF